MLAESVASKQIAAMKFSLPYVAPVLMLVASNVFMTFAWYGHLKFGSKPLWLVVMVSWGIALFEYCLAVPANRIGHSVYSTAELKTMQEVITLLVFAVFSVTFLGEKLTMNHAVGFSLIFAGAWFIFRGPFAA
ncbi:DMT family protein [soil metagenome]